MGNPRKTKRTKKNIYLAGILFCSVGLLIAGLTLAYFSDRDTVTNRQGAKDISIQLMELNWQTTGREKAARMEPGMVIEKDPCVYNSCEADVYVRMRIELLDENGNEIISGNRYDAILSALYCHEDDVPLFDSGLSFSQNTAFVYENGWFYYKTEEGYTVLSPKESTPSLFDYLKIPILKTEYNGIFDSEFTIRIIAQAVSATYETEEDIKAAFEEVDPSATSTNG